MIGSSFLITEQNDVALASADFACLSALTVPGPVPSQSLRATPSEETISLYWKEPAEPNGVITQYEVLSAAGVVIGSKLTTCSLG